MFVMVADEIMGGRRPQWEHWTCDSVMSSCPRNADGMLLFFL